MQSKPRNLIGVIISLITIALIILTILTATRLENFMQRRSLIQELGKIERSINLFTKTYNFPPGDFPKADIFFGLEAKTNGNGNQIYDLNPHNQPEIAQIAQHLSSSKMLRDLDLISLNSFKSQIIPAAIYKFSENCPLITGGIFNESNHKFSIIFTKATNNLSWNPSISPHDAYYIDQKIDDGQAQTGKLLGFAPKTRQQNNCLTKTIKTCSSSPKHATYQKQNKLPSCNLSLNLKNNITKY